MISVPVKMVRAAVTPYVENNPMPECCAVIADPFMRLSGFGDPTTYGPIYASYALEGLFGLMDDDLVCIPEEHEEDRPF